ncbi:Serine/threonine-protein kinase SRPK [Paramyrothecium foliicola]|nr:Serine/threonine-protein kinase SRPK [Paramyrothecium foliicola]
MSTSNFEYRHIEDVEQLEGYQPGGYHPVHLNDHLHDRYRIVHKLGHGSFSTAWLGLDEKTSKYVAIKVGIADADKREVDILSQLTAKVAASGEKASMIPIAIDRFSIDGPNGTHSCFVTFPARCSLMDAKEASNPWFFQLDVARSLAAQLVMAVSLVHSQGYAHGGAYTSSHIILFIRLLIPVLDLHLENILLRLPASLNSLSIDELYAKFGAPEPEPVVRLDGEPVSPSSGVSQYAVPPVWLGKASDEITIREARLLLSDFGVAFRPSDKSRFESYTPLVIRPPEAYFEPTVPLSFASDIWSLGCIIFELFAHRSLIDGILAPQDDITAQQVHLQGKMPSEWWDNWELRHKWFDEAGRPLSKENDIWPWSRRFEQWVQEPRRSYCLPVMSEEERIALFATLQWMLSWKPHERPKAEELLNTTWMKGWALPAYEEGQETSS